MVQVCRDILYLQSESLIKIMNKLLTCVAVSIFIITLSGCSISNYSKSEFNKDKLKNKTVVFYMDSSNDTVRVNKKGLFIPIPFTGKPVYNREIFRESLADLAEETQVNLKYSDTLRASNDSVIYINTNLLNNTWKASFFHITMLSDINYKVRDNETYTQKGRYRNYFGGHGLTFLYKSYKNANFQIVKKLTDSLMVN